MKTTELKLKHDGRVRSSDFVRRAAARTLKRLKDETVFQCVRPICFDEWRECVGIIAEEMSKLPPNDRTETPPTNGVRKP